MHAKLLLLGTLAVALLSAQTHPVLGEDTVKISEHVWAIMGWPNIAIVVGSRATLVFRAAQWISWLMYELSWSSRRSVVSPMT